jgi:DNA-binding GntR family transcriptional regulator
MTETLQIPNLAHGIAEYIRSEGLAPGTRLPGRKLAERFRVSRTPVERALRLLEEHQVVSPSASGGYEVRPGPVAISPEVLGAETQSEDDRLYLQLADDHAAGRLPARASESELIRRYGTSRGMILRVLRRAAGEGWTERLPGRGWAFIPLLTSGLTYEQICRFRIVVEPAAMLEPTFVLDRPALEACRQEQAAMFDGAGRDLSPVELFESGSRFHQTVLACSRNPFFINGLTQANRVRRLIEYRKTMGSVNWRKRCKHHVRIAELLLDGARAEAASLMRKHLEQGAREKSLLP